jgi:small GTP-binding protein
VRLEDGRLVFFTADALVERGTPLALGERVVARLTEDGPRPTVVSLKRHGSKGALRDVRKRIATAEDALHSVRGRPLTLLLVGRTGVGKSSTVNELLGVDVAEVGHHESTTASVRAYHGTIGSTPVSIVDTPGFCDDRPDKGNDARYIAEVARYVGEVDLMLFATTLDDTRVRADEIRALELLTEQFGAAIWAVAVVVMTRADLVTRAGYAEQLAGRSEAIRKRLREITPHAETVPLVPVTNLKPRTPDRRIWLPRLWIAALERMSTEGFVPFFLSTVSRVETDASSRSRDMTSARKMKRSSITPAALPSRSRERDSRTAIATQERERLEHETDRSSLNADGAFTAPTKFAPTRSERPPEVGPLVHAQAEELVSGEVMAVEQLTRPSQAVSPVADVPYDDGLAPRASVLISSTTEREVGGVRHVETKFSVTEGRGTIVLTGDQPRVVQQLVEHRAPNLLLELARLGLSIARKVKRLFGF